MKTITHNGVPCVEARVHMVATDVVHYIGVCIKPMSDRKVGNIEYFRSPMFMSLEYWQPQHLYITTDEEIKEGDWYLTDNLLVLKVNKLLMGLVYAEGDHGRQIRHCRKIISTTDPKLRFGNVTGEIETDTSFPLSQIPQSFIEEYCKAGGIENVRVECEVTFDNKKWLPENRKVQLKTDSNNCIIIHPVEEKMYSNNELFRAFCHTFVDSDGKLELEMVEILMDRFNKFKENL